MHALFCKFFSVSAVQKLLKSVRFDSCSHVYTATFYEPQQKCSLWFLQVRCAHKSGDVINFTIVACRISSRIKLYKNCKNRLRLAKVIVKNKMSRFLWFTVYILLARVYINSPSIGLVTIKSCYFCANVSQNVQPIVIIIIVVVVDRPITEHSTFVIFPYWTKHNITRRNITEHIYASKRRPVLLHY